MAATPQERAAIDRDVQALQLRMERAEDYAAYLRGKVWNSDAEKAKLKNIADERTRFTTWATTWRQWALNGWNPKDNIAYPVSFWQRIGQDIDKALLAYSDGYSSPDNKKPLAFTDPNSLTNTVTTVVTDTARQIQNPSLWPTWLKVTVGVGASAVAVIVIVNVATIVRGLKS